MSVVLVLLAGFVVVGWRRAANVNVGFNPEHLHFLSVDPVRDGHGGEQAGQLIDRVQTRLQTAPGVVTVSVAQTVPLALSGAERDAHLTGSADLADPIPAYDDGSVPLGRGAARIHDGYVRKDHSLRGGLASPQRRGEQRRDENQNSKPVGHVSSWFRHQTARARFSTASRFV